MVSLEFRLLGRVEVFRGGRPVDVGGPKQRAVLASLLLRPRRVVSVEQLIDDVWPERPPARAAATVQVFVSQLRRALEPGRSSGEAATLLVTASPGYRLDIEPDQVDARVFADLVVRGRAALDAGDPERAAQVLLRAEEMWRRPAARHVRGEGPGSAVPAGRDTYRCREQRRRRRAVAGRADRRRAQTRRSGAARPRLRPPADRGRHSAVVQTLFSAQLFAGPDGAGAAPRRPRSAPADPRKQRGSMR